MWTLYPARHFVLATCAVYCILWPVLSIVCTPVLAADPITPSGLNTQVTLSTTPPPGKVQYDITGGTRPGSGANLFHSFGNFNVPSNNIANFLNDSGLPTSNILGRVTGGNISSIFGTIQTTGFGSANLFLMNPAGFLFGPNATVNVGGMVTFTSADYLRLADGVQFNAVPNPAADALLSTSPVVAYGFLGSNPGAITVQGSHLTVADGTGISLIGGNITVQSGTLEDGTVQPAQLLAPGGQVNLASVASPGEILSSNLQAAPNINRQSFTTMGNIELLEGVLLDVSADAAGTVRIRGGQLMINNAAISANTGNASASSLAVDINLTGDLALLDTRDVPLISATSSGAGNAGRIQISAANIDAVQVTAPNPGFTGAPFIDSHSSADGRGGDISLTTGNLSVSSSGPKFFLDSGPQGNGHGGDITIVASNHIELNNAYVSTGTQQAELLGLTPSTSSGNLAITADSLHAINTILDTHANTVFEASQSGGDITLNIRHISMSGTQVGASGVGRGGAITISSDSLIATDNSQFQTFNMLVPGGGITFTGRSLELSNGSNWSTSTFGDAKAGDLIVNATDHVSLSGITTTVGTFNPSGLFSNSFGGAGTQGAAGNILVTTPRLVMQEGRINTSTASSGAGGNVTINANVIEISGEFPFPDNGGFFGITNIHPSGIFTQTVGTEFCSGVCGNAGNINISTGVLTLGNGSQINSGTTNSGQGGTITIQAENQIIVSGTLSNGDSAGIFSRTVGADPSSGTGGNITLNAGQSVKISNGASVSASSTGVGNAGNVLINAGQQLLLQNGSITTESAHASGGNISIQAIDLVQLQNSTISASVQGGPQTSGGNINIDPQFVILQNSQILAQAAQGSGGNINITITNGGLFLPDGSSLVDASSRFGQNGAVTIQQPIAPAGGKIQPLGKTPIQVTALLSQRCAAIARGEVSSFVVAGRDTLPTEPGGWLTSPLAFGPAEAGAAMQAGVPSVELESDNSTIVSLRRLPSSSKISQLLGDDWLTDCAS